MLHGCKSRRLRRLVLGGGGGGGGLTDAVVKNLCGHGSALNGAHEDAVRTSAI